MRRWALKLAVLLAFGFLTMMHLPAFLTVSDTPEPADVVVVIAGDSSGERVDHAVSLIKAGYAKKLLISGGPIYVETTWASLIRDRAIKLGIAPEQIILQDRSWTTLQDATYSTPLLQELGVKKAILTTSIWHSRRAIRIFRKAAPEIEWLSCPAPKTWEGGWWQDPGLVRAIAMEYLKFLWPE